MTTPPRMLLLGKITLVCGLCLLALAGLGAAGLARGVTGDALLWMSLAGGAGFLGGAVLIGFGALEARVAAQQALLLELHRRAEAPAPAPARPAEEPMPFRSRPAAVGQRRLKLI